MLTRELIAWARQYEQGASGTGCGLYYGSCFRPVEVRTAGSGQGTFFRIGMLVLSAAVMDSWELKQATVASVLLQR